MSKHISSLLILLFIASSCQTVEELSIDYMIPSELSFPGELRKVAVVNNIGATPDAMSSDEIQKVIGKGGGKKTYSLTVKSAVATESLAKAIAADNYFDEVIICDSALRANDLHARENILSRNEVTELTQKLQADIIVSLEDVQVQVQRNIRLKPEWNCFWGTVDAKIYPVIRVYIPNRMGPMASIVTNDSIFWEDFGSELHVRSKLIPDSVVIEEVSEFAGTIPARYLSPQWKSATRYFYGGGSISMRDAAHFARENQWDKAFPIWEKALNSTKSKKKQMYLSHNIALYYEMTDKLEEAGVWAKKTLDLAYELEDVEIGITKGISPEYYPLSVQATLYYSEIEKRIENLMKLNAQMNRFANDF